MSAAHPADPAGIIVVTARDGNDTRRTYRLGRHHGQTPRQALDEYFAASIAIAADGSSFTGRDETGAFVLTGALSYEDVPS